MAQCGNAKMQRRDETLTLIHVFQSCSQDSIAFLDVIEDAVKQLKEGMPLV